MDETDDRRQALLGKNKRNEEEEEDNRSERRWWNGLLDMKEAKEQILFSLPMILTNVFYYMIPLVSVMFAGHLGQLELAGATLANSWATVTGYAFMVGLSGALETLCGQGYGAKMFKILGIHLQASCVTSLIFSLIISIFWFFTEPILVLLHQDPLIARSAALYMKYLIPSVFAYGLIQNILRFLQTQSVVRPLVFFSGIPLLLHVGLTFCLVHFTPLGFSGAPVAVSVSMWLSLLLLVVYVLFSSKFEETWTGFSAEAFCYVHDNLRLAIPSAAMVCLEYWAFEILVFLAGLMPNAEISTSLIAICVNTEAIAYMVTYGLSATASTRVSNELGADDPKKAKSAMFVSLKLSGFLAIVVVSALVFGHDIWAGSFSDSPEIIDSFASMTPLLVVSIIIDSIQGVLSGVARGCGWQHIAVYVNLAMFYLVGMTVAALLAFMAKLYVKGLWLGLICGLGCQAATLMVITMRIKWTKLTLSQHGEKNNQFLA